MKTKRKININVSVCEGTKDNLTAIQEAYEANFKSKMPLSVITGELLQRGIDTIDWAEVLQSPISLFVRETKTDEK
jgi:hypothetical protein